ncbi:MAG: hypothetical protein SangKO_054790 [Sandaracinaceae bacterium]
MKRYPLEALDLVRREAERGAERQLVEALEARSRAEAAVTEARATLTAHRRDEAARRAQTDRATGPTSSAALLREEAFRRRQDREERRLAAALEQALRREAEARGEVEHARSALNDAAVERVVVERHRARWDADLQKRRERESEEELAEAARRRE